MPYANTIHYKNKQKVEISRTEWMHIFNQWIKKAFSSYNKVQIECDFSPLASGNYVNGILKEIYTSDIIVADLTTRSCDVYYQLGIRHALRKGSIIISQNVVNLAADISSYYCVEYNYNKDVNEYKTNFMKFESLLHEALDSYLINKAKPDSPVSDFLAPSHYNYVPSKETKAKSVHLEEIKVDIIKLLKSKEPKRATLEEIAYHLSVGPEKIENHITFLADNHYIFGGSAFGSPVYFALTPKGKSFLIDNSIII